MNSRTLLVEFHDLWHVGSGRGRGAHLDAVVDRDESGLPYVPGRMLKGVLRDAAERLAGWHPGAAGDPGLLGKLFGSPDHGKFGTQHEEDHAGALRVSDARLPNEVTDWLASDDGERYRERLYREHFSTAIEHASGTAVEKSLRGIEVVVPMTLAAEIHIIGDRDADTGFALLKHAFPLVRSLGAHRTRGFGRVSLTFKDQA